ncbi:hypothetical protein DEO72_LG2g2618 [Vigna unguiculata]|uniref:Uncharacterized protein n=1 Tax=Vigna unguiculata TaxID=3917 RepID=A0A4D6L1C0_VIGUN|nr:hypothetical protein DEO72_LG2g2618 [Vigna unguiculata]
MALLKMKGCRANARGNYWCAWFVEGLGRGGMRSAVNTQEKWLATKAKAKTLFDIVSELSESSKLFDKACVVGPQFVAKEVVRKSTCTNEFCNLWRGSRQPQRCGGLG